MVLAGVGGVDHGELSFGALPVSSNPIPLGRNLHPKPDFVGSKVRVRDNDVPTAHIAVAVKGVSWSSPDYYWQ
jgi:mitochondrial-processing peptidase subunit beta